MDKISKEARSRNMQKIKSRDTSIEIRIRKALWRCGIRGYRVHSTAVPGRPDLAFLGMKIAIFIDGCFWHGCPTCYKSPQSNVGFWQRKVEYNRRRDSGNETKLNVMGWTVIRIWEHSVKKDIEGSILEIVDTIRRKRKKA